jgi:hypothetical protein
VFFTSTTGAGVGFHKQSIFEPGEPQSVSACGSFIELFRKINVMLKQE